jgi:ABC-type uncharacterized transport system ATPase subunit
VKISCHLQKRMSERNISLGVINLVMSLGSFSDNSERLILDEKTLALAIQCTDSLKKQLVSLQQKKGASVALTDDLLMTSFFHYGKKNAKNKQRQNIKQFS